MFTGSPDVGRGSTDAESPGSRSRKPDRTAGKCNERNRTTDCGTTG